MKKDLINRVVLEKYGRAPVPHVRRLLASASQVRRGQNIEAAKLVLKNARLCRKESLRIAAAKVLVASLPETFGDIQSFLTDFSRPLSYEVHFTLFCFLDPDELPNREGLRRRIFSLVKSYLMNSNAKTGSAAWMAGDLLGDHWRRREAVDALCEIAANAEHPVARESAIHGLAHALDWASPARRKRILGLFEKISSMDTCESVRLSGRMALGGRGK